MTARFSLQAVGAAGPPSPPSSSTPAPPWLATQMVHGPADRGHATLEGGGGEAASRSTASASRRSGASRPSVNQPWTGARSARASPPRPWSRHSRARLVAARSSTSSRPAPGRQPKPCRGRLRRRLIGVGRRQQQLAPEPVQLGLEPAAPVPLHPVQRLGRGSRPAPGRPARACACASRGSSRAPPQLRAPRLPRVSGDAAAHPGDLVPSSIKPTLPHPVIAHPPTTVPTAAGIGNPCSVARTTSASASVPHLSWSGGWRP